MKLLVAIFVLMCFNLFVFIAARDAFWAGVAAVIVLLLGTVIVAVKRANV